MIFLWKFLYKIFAMSCFNIFQDRCSPELKSEDEILFLWDR